MSGRSAAEEEAWRYIVFRLENDPGFWFGLIAGDDRRPRKRLRNRAEAWCKAHEVAFFEHARAPGELRMLAVDLGSEPKKGLHWIHADGPEALATEWDAGTKAMLMAMNERRDAYRRHLHAGVIVDGRLSLKPILRDFAPDMFSIRAFVVEAGSDAAEPLPVPVRPQMYFLVPPPLPSESADALLARAERLAAIDDPDARRLHAQAALNALEQLGAEGRWSEVRLVAERLLREDAHNGGLEPLANVYRLFIQAMDAAARIETEAPLDALARVRDVLDALSRSRDGGLRGSDVFSAVLLRSVELRALQRLQRWEEAQVSLSALAKVIGDVGLDVELLQLSPILSLLFESCHRIAASFRERGRLKEAIATVDVLLNLIERARLRSPGDPRWHMERARVLLLRVDDLLLKGDFAAALTVSDDVVTLIDEHGDVDAHHWQWVRAGALFGRLVSLAMLQEWQKASDLGRALLDDPLFRSSEAPESQWLSAEVAIWRTHAVHSLGHVPDLQAAVDEALGALETALSAGGSAPGASVRLTARLLSMRVSGTLRDGETALETVRALMALLNRLRRSERVFAGVLARFPLEAGRLALLDVMTPHLEVIGLLPVRRRGLWITNRARARLRRQLRAIRRWRPGKRLPPFVLRAARQLHKQAEP